jgi:hypothetical protein
MIAAHTRLRDMFTHRFLAFAIGCLLGELLPGCTSQPGTMPDAGPLPSCASVGCTASSALCKRDGECSCPQADGKIVECQRELPDAGAEIDAP